MKKYTSALSILSLGLCICSCGNNSGSTTATDSTSNTTTMSSPDSTKNNNSTTTETNNQPTPTTTTTSSTPLSKSDSTVVMDLAVAGMTEVEAGNIAQQNGMSQRVKDFGSMMVRDHTQAGNELKSLASTKGLNLPSSLPADKMQHLDAMKKMKGKDFDSHYISMMVDGHKKVSAELEKTSKDAKDPDLKAWAIKTLPVVQMHLDSAKAISKSH